MKSIQSMVAVTLFAAVAAGCGDTSGPGTGDVRVYMNKASVTSAQTSGYSMAALMLGTIPITAVDSINVVLTSIEAVNVSDSSGGVSISLQGAGTTSLNLMRLALSDSTLLARGTLPAGTYNNIRLRFSSASIRLNQQVTVGQAVYPAGTYDLTVPSGLSSGIKVQGASFTIANDASTSVTLTFDPTTTVGTIVATGSNKLMMSPVLHVRTHVGD
ncbi:MAG: DUF4382 domain-containing protein [Longimicrobiales bacterium]